MAFRPPVQSPHLSPRHESLSASERRLSENSQNKSLDRPSEFSQEPLSKRQKLHNWNSASQTNSGAYPRWRLKLLKFIRSWAFETVVGLLVMFNVAISWYQTDVTAAPKSQEDLPPWVETANIVLFILYSVEIMLRMIALQGKFFEGWFNWDTFDLFLVCSDLIPLLISLFVQVDQNAVIRALRMCRALRMVKAIRVWPAFRELYVMMHGFLGALRAMLWSSVLLGLLLTLFGIVSVEVLNPLALEIERQHGFGDCVRCHRAFATVWSSMTTFFQQVVAGDSWGQITIPVMEAHPWTAIIFISAVVTIQFGILNLILVAIVEQANKASNDDAMFQAMTRKEEFESARKELLEVCADLDTDKSGEISLKELVVGYESLPELANQLRFLDVKKEDMTILFNTLDHDGSGQVNYEEFVEQLFGMQNSDTGVLLALLRTYIQDLRKTSSAQGEVILQMQQMLQELVSPQKAVVLPSKQVESFDSLLTSESPFVSVNSPHLEKYVETRQSSEIMRQPKDGDTTGDAWPKEDALVIEMQQLKERLQEKAYIDTCVALKEDALGAEMQQLKERLQEKACVDTGMALKVGLQQAAKESLDALENYHLQAVALLQQTFGQHGLMLENSASYARQTADTATALRASGSGMAETLVLHPFESVLPVTRPGANLLLHSRRHNDYLHSDSKVCSEPRDEGPIASACECCPARRPYDPTKE